MRTESYISVEGRLYRTPMIPGIVHWQWTFEGWEPASGWDRRLFERVESIPDGEEVEVIDPPDEER